MFAASSMLAKQFPGVSGLQDTLLGPANDFSVVTSPFVQILHNNANHWLTVASAPQGDAADVIIDDSLHNNINTDTQLMITQLLNTFSHQVCDRHEPEADGHQGLWTVHNRNSDIFLLWGMSKRKTLSAIKDAWTFPSVPRKGRNDAIPE